MGKYDVTWVCPIAGCKHKQQQPPGVTFVSHMVDGTEHVLRREKRNANSNARS